VAIALAASCVAALSAWACLPNLAINRGFCGDGVIEPDRGDGGEECDPGDGASPSAQGCTSSCQVACGAPGATSPFTDPATNHCYFVLANTKALPAAETNCGDAGGHVVRFSGAAEVALVASKSPVSQFWVGLREDTVMPPSLRWLPSETTSPEPGWTVSCAGCFALASGASFPANSALLSQDAGAYPCVDSTNGQGPWLESPCSLEDHQTLCEREPAGTRSQACAYGACFTAAVTSKRYVLYATRESLSSAYSICQTMGGQIVTLGTPEEREEVGEEVARQSVFEGGADYWIGLTSNGTAWVWDEPDAGMQPPPWATDPGDAAGFDAGARAYVIVQRGLLASELAYVANPGETHYPLCQY
jgi:hypothetical protein